MSNQTRVCWLHHSAVYHRARFRTRGDKSWQGSWLVAPCGVKVATSHFRCMEGSEKVARVRHGLRACRRCFPASGPCIRSGDE